MSTPRDDSDIEGIEQLLRDTFSGRAATVDSGPRLPTVPGRRKPTRHRQARWLMPLAAAAAVAAIALVVTLSGGPAPHPPATDRSTIATGAPTGRHSSDTTNSPAPATRHACTVPLPQAWIAAVEHADLDVGGIATEPLLALGADGTAVVLEDGGPLPGAARTVELLTPGTSPRTVYPVPDPDNFTVDEAALSGHWLVLARSSYPRPAKNTIPNTNAVIRALIAIDLRNDSAQVIVTAPPAAGGHSRTIEEMRVVDGTVYWAERSSYSSPRASVRSYRLGSGATGTAYEGPLPHYPAFGLAAVPAVTRTPGGVLLPADLPAPVASSLPDADALNLVTDGRNYAWLASATVLAWWSPGASSPVYLQLPRGVSNYDRPGALAISGDFVVVGSPSRWLVDAPSGALAPLDVPGILGGRSAGDLYYGAGHYLGGVHYPSGSYWVDGYHVDPVGATLRVDTARLPALTC